MALPAEGGNRLFSIAAPCAALCATLAFASCSMTDAAFSARLKAMDAALGMGRTGKAASLLSATKAGSSTGRLQSLLKREYRLSLMTGNQDRYLKAALKAAGASAAPELRALAAQALLEAGRAGEAGGMALQARGAPGKARGLALAIRLSAAKVDATEALSYDASSWTALAAESGDRGYILNAALSALAAGDRPAAALALKEALASGVPVPPLVAFEAGLYRECLGLIDAKKKTGAIAPIEARALAELEADAASLSGDGRRAAAAWEGILAAHPGSAAAAYHDIAAGEQDPARLEEALKRGVERFPAERGPGLDLAAFYAKAGRKAEGLAALAALGPGEEDDYLIAGLRLASIGEADSRREGELLKAASSRPGDGEIARFAFFELLGIRREAAAFGLLLDREKALEGSPWLPFARACLLAAEGKGAEAIEAFDACDSPAVHYASTWDAALLSYRVKDWRGALKRLSAAATIAAGHRERADAYAFMGDCSRALGEADSAAAAYRAALAEWPGCRRAALALAGMETAGTEKEP